MKMSFITRVSTWLVAVELGAFALASCGTLTGATLGGATGAGVGAATHSDVGRSAAIGAGVGGTAGALYDIFGHRHSYSDRDYYD